MSSIPTMTEEKVRAITSSITEILIKKNQDYGGASFDLGTIGNMVHLWDKIKRYRNLIEKTLNDKSEPNFESLEDTLKDIIGYSIIGLIILEHESQQRISSLI